MVEFWPDLKFISDAPQRALRVGCVPYLNAKPLVHGLGREMGPWGLVGGDEVGEEMGEGGGDEPTVEFVAPAKLLPKLESGTLDVALLPVIDLWRSEVPLQVVTNGRIGCDGPTWTVRLFSRVPIEEVTTVHCDTESHTSAGLVEVLLMSRYETEMEAVDFKPTAGNMEWLREDDGPEAVLLIGDKVVASPPPRGVYPYEWDLGEVWREEEDLPFTFAVWATRYGVDLRGLPKRLDKTLERNLADIVGLVERYAGPHGWDAGQAAEYMGGVLQYRVDCDDLEGMRRFGELAAMSGLVPWPPGPEPTEEHPPGERFELQLYPF